MKEQPLFSSDWFGMCAGVNICISEHDMFSILEVVEEMSGTSEALLFILPTLQCSVYMHCVLKVLSHALRARGPCNVIF